MKVFLIGGVSIDSADPNYTQQKDELDSSMSQLGQSIAAAGHDLLVCSPFVGTADVAAAKGALERSADFRDGADIEFHHPDSAAVVAEMQSFRKRFPSFRNLKSFLHPTPKNEKGEDVFEYAWLLSQTYAMDRSHAVVALGGKVGKSASLLLGLVDVRQKPLIPLTFLGGAAAQAFDRRRYLLEDRLGQDIAALHDSHRSAEIVGLLVKASSNESASDCSSTPKRARICLLKHCA